MTEEFSDKFEIGGQDEVILHPSQALGRRPSAKIDDRGIVIR
jgi:hypothetical protein